MAGESANKTFYDHVLEPITTEMGEKVPSNDPIELTGARNDPESALANLIALLETKGILTDSTTDV